VQQKGKRKEEEKVRKKGKKRKGKKMKCRQKREKGKGTQNTCRLRNLSVSLTYWLLFHFQKSGAMHKKKKR
jgi:hypothetical protein